MERRIESTAAGGTPGRPQRTSGGRAGAARRTAAVLGRDGPNTRELRSALLRSGLRLSEVGLDDVLTPAGPQAASLLGTDLVLVGSSLAEVAVRALVDAMSGHVIPAPVVVVFVDGHGGTTDELRSWAVQGFDYVLPPFPSDVLLRRVATWSERAQLAEMTKAVQEAAHLVEYERELRIGREIQEGFLPRTLPAHDGWEFQVLFRPAREVAGDFYDAFPVVNGRRMGFVVADVCDKGVGAALFMALIRSLLRHTASHVSSRSVVGLDVRWVDEPAPTPDRPRATMTSAGIAPLLTAVVATNAYMTENHMSQGYFATMFFGVLDPATGAVLYVNGGHNPPILRSADGDLRHLNPTGPAVGMLPGAEFRLGRAELLPGDALYLYTDGVTEAKDAAGGFFGDQRLLEEVARPLTGARDLVERLDREVREHVGPAAQFDDITMMTLYRLPEPRPSADSGEVER